MKKAVLPIVLFCILAIITVWSCKKNYNPGTSGITPSLNQVFAALRYTPQNLSVTAGRDTVVYATNGTRLHFYTNSFKNESGSIITSGTVNLQIVEMYKPGDMICNHATTMANGEILASGGQVSISATMNGQIVHANAYGIGFPHGNPSSTTMSLFYGGTGNADSVVTWGQSDTTKPGNVAKGTIEDSVRLSSHAIFNFDTCNNFTSVNCDCFWKYPSSKTSISVILPDTSFNARNTEIFVVLKNIRAWSLSSSADTTTAVLSNVGPWGGTNYNSTTNTLSMQSEGQSAIVPAGLPYTLVVITNKNGTYYFWQTSGTVPDNGIIVTAAMATDTQGDIVSRLQGL